MRKTTRRKFLTATTVTAATMTASTFGLTIPGDRASATTVERDRRAALTVWQLPNRTHSQMESYLLWANDPPDDGDGGKLLVIDGGTQGDREYLVEMIRVMRALKTGRPCREAVVDAWFLTHDHSDHVGALAKLIQERREENRWADLRIGGVYYAFPPVEWIDRNEHYCVESTRFARSQLESLGDKVTIVKKDDQWTYGNLKIHALNDFDLSITKNAINNSTIVYRLTTPATSLLILGDLGEEGGERLQRLQSPDLIRSDVVQMAHHGQQGVTRAFYETVSPSMCLWPTPDWLWTNDSGKGPGSGPWKTLETRS
ncbi:MAG: MBL fold metallo-hydrolase, partial [Planctomycetia bacterium]|nr:MBL fold metallo-hydrolase [Planctomycetia bacterium]